MNNNRLILNYKGLPYSVEWVEYPDIESVCKRIGAKPTSKKSDGSDLYTLPTITDSSTGAVISDSAAIAKYLDETYPETPRLFPAGKEAAIALAESYFMTNFVPAVGPVVLPRAYEILYPRSQEYFRGTYEKIFGMKLEDICPPGPKFDEGIVKIKEALSKVADIWDQNGADKHYFFGDEFTYADIVVAAFLLATKIVAPDIWETLRSENGGRWARLLEVTKPYQKFN